MAKENRGNILGSWSFLIGVILALIIGIFGSPNSMITSYILVGLGVVVGLFNITNKEAHPFMISGVILVLVATLGQTVLGPIIYINSMLESLVVLFVPATIIVTLRNVFSMARH